jgi:photolyase PhrII
MANGSVASQLPSFEQKNSMALAEWLKSLPGHLLERTRTHNIGADTNHEKSQRFVLYWMRTAVRSDENPALDVAKQFADQAGVPLQVYHAISEHYQFASDRHHMFMLQGARDVQQHFKEAEIGYAFHLATTNDRRPHLVELANQAAVVVTEDMPVDPPRRFLKALLASTKTPVVSVDAACVAPMMLVKKAYTRAFKFRSATKKIYAERLSRAWPESKIAVKLFNSSQLPFEPVDLQTADLADLVSQCEIDHSIGPVVDTIGGSVAGYQRWKEFKTKRLSRYARQRNNALLEGVSRMSAYLHYGMVSPFRIARESAEIDNAGSEKYLDELLIWRELAYAFCFYRDDYNQWSAIPDWAREALDRHAADLRLEIYSDEQLARAQTNNEFWNAAQQSLLIQGELHNNVRMTWGKAILDWKQSPREALSTIIDLNHRYALDGRDPASYGGILWCLGQFDRPFEPEQNIIGTVRPRPTSNHASRLDTEAYRAKVSKPRFNPIRVAVIGAGISGLFAARTLLDHGIEVTVFDKGRGVGGRMSTRRIGQRGDGNSFDHGAQYFTARDRRFIRYVSSWVDQGIVAKWPDQNAGRDNRIVVLKDGEIQSESKADDRFVGVPGMTAICKHLSSGIDVKTQTRVKKIENINAGIELFDESEGSLGCFDRLIVSAPAAQSADLLVNFPDLAAKISQVTMNPCWAAMVALDSPITDQWVGAFLHNSFLSWAARNNTKPGRNRNAEHLVIHANPQWTEQHWEHDPEEVAQRMLSEFWRVAGTLPIQHHQLNSHRWKYAIPVEPSNARFFANESLTVIACGDWASGSRVEGAFLSGMSAAGCILRRLAPLPGEKEVQASLF